MGEARQAWLGMNGNERKRPLGLVSHAALTPQDQDHEIFVWSTLVP